MMEEIKNIVWVARFLRRLPKGKALVSAVKQRASLDLVQVLHTDVIHRMRQLSASMGIEDWEASSEKAIEVCTACSKIMANLLELSPHEGFFPREMHGGIGYGCHSCEIGTF